MIVTIALAPLANGPRLQVTTVAVLVQEPCELTAETNVDAAGNVSETVAAFVTLDNPRF